MALKGNLNQFSTVQLLNLISLARKTGSLTIDGESKAQLSFRAGTLVYASMDGTSQQLPQILWQQGRLSAEQAATVQAHADGLGDRRTGQLLVQAGHFDRDEIDNCVRNHAADIASDVVAWTDGAFCFEEGVLPDANHIFVSVDLERVIEEGEHRREEWQRLKEEMPHLDLFLRCPQNPSRRLFDVSLTLREWRVMISSNPGRSMRQIAQENNLSPFHIRRIVYGLWKLGLLELEPAPMTLPLFA